MVFKNLKVFDESLPKRPWDNFHFVEFNEILNIEDDYEFVSSDPQKKLAFAVQSLLEIPDQYNHIRKLGMLPPKK